MTKFIEKQTAHCFQMRISATSLSGDFLYKSICGVDPIYDNKADNNIFRFGAGIKKEDIKLHLGSLLLDLGDGDAVHISDFDQYDVFNSSSVSSFEFADGSVLTTAELLARDFDLDGNGKRAIPSVKTQDCGVACNEIEWRKAA